MEGDAWMSWIDKFRVLNEIAKAYLGKENYFNQEEEHVQEKDALEKEERYWVTNFAALIIEDKKKRDKK